MSNIEAITTSATTFVTATGVITPEHLETLVGIINQSGLFVLPYNADFSKVQNFNINLQSDGTAKFNTKIKIP